MIEHLIPQAARLDEQGVILQWGPLALSALSSSRAADAIVAASASEGLPLVPVELEIDDNPGRLVLVAFASSEERFLYRALRKVQGIGRASALACLDCGEVSDVLRAVAGHDGAFFRSVPGLGAKRIAAVIEQLAATYKQSLPQPLELPVSEWITAREGLIAGGLESEQAERVLKTAFETSEPPPRDGESLFRAASKLAKQAGV